MLSCQLKPVVTPLRVLFMISFEAFKASLGKTADELSDEQIERIRYAFDKIADMAFTQWVKRTHTT